MPLYSLNRKLHHMYKIEMLVWADSDHQLYIISIDKINVISFHLHFVYSPPNSCKRSQQLHVPNLFILISFWLNLKFLSSDTTNAGDGFKGCVFRSQFDNVYPLKRVFQDPRPSYITLEPEGRKCTIISSNRYIHFSGNRLS